MSRSKEHCIVFGCTDEFGCDEGCWWITHFPPLCSSCVSTFIVAELWNVAVKARSIKALDRQIDDLKRIAEICAKGAEQFGMPSIHEVRVIGRRMEKWRKDTPVSLIGRRAGNSRRGKERSAAR